MAKSVRPHQFVLAREALAYHLGETSAVSLERLREWASEHEPWELTNIIGTFVDEVVNACDSGVVDFKLSQYQLFTD